MMRTERQKVIYLFYFFRIFFCVISTSAASKHCQAVIIYGCCVALIQKDKFRLHTYTITRKRMDRISLLFRCSCTFCPNALAIMKNAKLCYVAWQKKGEMNTIIIYIYIYLCQTAFQARFFQGKVTQGCRDPIYERLRASQCHLEPSWTP